jgi:hypothetical protein
MSTDFLDLLEADLREAAQRRGQPQPRRHRPPRGTFKVIAALAVIALLVVAAARVLDRTDNRHPAQPTPTPTFQPPHVKVLAATEGNPGLVDVMSATLGGYLIVDHDVGGVTAPPSLGTVVLYRPESKGAKDAAEMAAFIEKIDVVRPMTKADEDALGRLPGPPAVWVVYGRERERQMLADPKICQPAGGDYKLCLSRSDEARYSAVYHDGQAFPQSTAPEPWWSWASLSPDGKSLLLEQSGECKFPITWVMDPKGGGGLGLNGAAEPRGWTTDGRVIVFVPQTPASARQGCAAESDPGLYLATRDLDMTRVGDKDVPRSIDARTPQEVSQAAG